MRILVTGSRDWIDEARLEEALCHAYNDLTWSDPDDHEEPVLVHGACPTGADEMARKLWVYEWALPDDPHPADWKKYGRAAGPIRNQEMVDLGADICLAFILPSSKGTVRCANAAEKAGIPVVRIYG